VHQFLIGLLTAQGSFAIETLWLHGKLQNPSGPVTSFLAMVAGIEEWELWGSDFLKRLTISTTALQL
jgi:hypothetical protein